MPGREWYIRRDILKYVEDRGWHTEIFVGNAFQKGIPDINIFRSDWGERWIDVKDPDRYSFTKAQRIKWPEWESVGRGVWILTAATEDEYNKLFKPPNWRDYWRESWAVEDVGQIVDGLGSANYY